MITLKINVLKIDKSKLYKGKKGTYLDLILIETPESEYGDYLCKQSGSREDDMLILGNGKILKPKPEAEIEPPADDDLPF